MCEARQEGCSMGGLVTTRLNPNDLAFRLANILFVLIAGAKQGTKLRNIESSEPIKQIDIILYNKYIYIIISNNFTYFLFIIFLFGYWIFLNSIIKYFFLK